MPKKGSKKKGWLEEKKTPCRRCGKMVAVIVEVGGKPPMKFCAKCNEGAEGGPEVLTPEDWRLITTEIHLCGKPRSLTLEEIAILSRDGAIVPFLPGALCCPAFGLYLIQMPPAELVEGE